MIGWGEFRRQRPDLAEAGQELFYRVGVGLAYLATVRRDGGPRVHPICPVIWGEGLFALIIPSPKRRDLIRDRRYALHAFPTPDNEDAFVVTGQAASRTDRVLRQAVDATFLAERGWTDAPPGFAEQELFEFLIDSCLLTRTTGHGDFDPKHTAWKVS